MDPAQIIKKIVIVGGGTAGWMTAAALSRAFQDRFCEINLVESSEIGIVGVGEATIPPILQMNRLLGLDENEFILRTGATFKVGIEFEDWNGPGSRYLHPFGPYGRQVGPVWFPHYWRRLRAEVGEAAGALDDYSLTAVAAREGRFLRSVQEAGGPPQPVTYAFHFDAGLYAAYLRGRAEARGVTRHDRKIRGHKVGENGFVESILFDGGGSLEGDLFIDCSGFRGLLIEEALETGYEEWTRWLPCDRAVTIPSDTMDTLPPFTRATARPAGWQWRIPLQHRTGNGHVYCSSYMSDDEAASLLTRNLPTPASGDPRLLRFTAGRRKLSWNRNVIAIGLSSGFLEPLESTSIHMIQTSIEKLLNLFPDCGFRQPDIDLYNHATANEYESVRDFLVLHYWANGRDEPFWKACRAIELPDRLKEKIALYEGFGRVFKREEELFSPVSWTAVFEGQGVHAAGFDPMTLGMPRATLERSLAQVRSATRDAVNSMLTHAEFVAGCCRVAQQPLPKDAGVERSPVA
jgi:tryptophan halogenase